jgi:hypothetical protein
LRKSWHLAGPIKKISNLPKGKKDEMREGSSEAGLKRHEVGGPK